jgi:hypothetical protein
MLNASYGHFGHFIKAPTDRFCQTDLANFRAIEKKKDGTTKTLALEIYELNEENKYEISTNVDEIIYQVYPFEENEEKKLAFVEGNYVFNDSTTNWRLILLKKMKLKMIVLLLVTKKDTQILNVNSSRLKVNLM